MFLTQRNDNVHAVLQHTINQEFLYRNVYNYYVSIRNILAGRVREREQTVYYVGDSSAKWQIHKARGRRKLPKKSLTESSDKSAPSVQQVTRKIDAGKNVPAHIIVTFQKGKKNSNRVFKPLGS